MTYKFSIICVNLFNKCFIFSRLFNISGIWFLFFLYVLYQKMYFIHVTIDCTGNDLRVTFS